MQVFLEYVIKGLVDQPEDVQVSPIERNGVKVYELRMNPDDVGKVIGRKGATIHALRSLLQVGSAKKGFRSSIEIIEDSKDSNPTSEK